MVRRRDTNNSEKREELDSPKHRAEALYDHLDMHPTSSKNNSESEDDAEDALQRLIQMRQEMMELDDENENENENEATADRMDMDYEFDDDDDDDVYATSSSHNASSRQGNGEGHDEEEEEEEEEEEDQEDGERAHGHDHDIDDDEDEGHPASFFPRRGGGPSRALNQFGLMNQRLFSALTNDILGFSSRVRPILSALRDREDHSVVMTGLEELADNLLVSNEDSLSSYFPVESFAEELISILTDASFEEQPEIMLLACRNLSNLMEALPTSVSSIVQHGAIPALCQKLFEIQFIDLAEQALSTLERISNDSPREVFNEGGLPACLTYLDFFSSHVQRTALTTAANMCRNIPNDAQFSMIRDVMPILENVLSNSDEKVCEKACICVCSIILSFADNRAKLQQLASNDLVKKLLSLVNPTISMAAIQSIRSDILTAIAALARGSSNVAGLLIEEKVGDLIFQILTNHTPMFDSSDSVKQDNGAIVQALIHTSRQLLIVSISIIRDILPRATYGDLENHLGSDEHRISGPYRFNREDMTSDLRERLDERTEKLSSLPPGSLEHFCRASIWLMLDIFSSSVDKAVRQAVLTSLIRILSLLQPMVLESVLEHVELSSVVGSILSQPESSWLIAGALEIGQLLLAKLPHIYRPVFYRLGIISEVQDIINELNEKKPDLEEDVEEDEEIEEDGEEEEQDEEEEEKEEDDEEDEEDENGEEEEEGDEQEEIRNIGNGPLTFFSDLSELLKKDAECLMHIYRAGYDNANSYEAEAARTIKDLKEITDVLLQRGENYGEYVAKLASIVDKTSGYELMFSGVLQAILESLTIGPQVQFCRQEFLKSFTAVALHDGESTHFASLIEKLQDILGRSERFEVISSGVDAQGRSGPAGMLARQIRIKLIADDDAGSGLEELPAQFHSIVLSIQAIATFKAVEDFLKSKVAFSRIVSDNGRRYASSSDSSARRLEKMFGTGHPISSALAALANASGMNRDGEGEDIDEHSGEESGVIDDIDVDEGEQNSGDHSHPTTPRNRRTSGISSLSPGRPKKNYAEAAEKNPDDNWHFEFSVGGEVIPQDCTVINAIFRRLENKKQQRYKNHEPPRSKFPTEIWYEIFTINYKKVDGQAVSSPTGNEIEAENLDPSLAIPSSFGNDQRISVTLRLLSVLFDMNTSLEPLNGMASRAPESLFISSKLTAKLNRQLDEPLIVASGILSPWMVDATRLYPFLFPFDTRYAFLQSTSFGYSRSMNRWQTASRSNAGASPGRDSTRTGEDNRPLMGRLLRQKVRVSRNHIMYSAIKVMDLCGSSPNVLEVEFFKEAGTGLGPTLEFYTLVSREFALKKYKLWRNDTDEKHNESDYVYSLNGLFPCPMNESMRNGSYGKKILQLFHTLGMFVARSMIDSRIIDINLNPAFFRVGLGRFTPSIGAISCIDQQLGNSLATIVEMKNGDQEKRAAIEHIMLDFTLPGYPEIELVENGSHINVTCDNVDEYLERVLDMTMGSGIQHQTDAFCEGFSKVFPFTALQAFTPSELSSLCGQGEEDWSVATLNDAIKADHGYTKDSDPVQDLISVIGAFDHKDRRKFLQFMTGSPKLPIGGFHALNPSFTVVLKQPEEPFGRDAFLPSVMTCANYLKLPEYTSKEILRDRLVKAMYEGQGAFLLS